MPNLYRTHFWMDIVAVKHNSASQDLHWLHKGFKQSKANKINKPLWYVKFSTWPLTVSRFTVFGIRTFICSLFTEID